MSAFTVLGYVSVMTNCAIFGLHSGLVDHVFPGISLAGVLVVVAVMEHAMIGMKLCIEMLVPDTPTSVTEVRHANICL